MLRFSHFSTRFDFSCFLCISFSITSSDVTLIRFNLGDDRVLLEILDSCSRYLRREMPSVQLGAVAFSFNLYLELHPPSDDSHLLLFTIYLAHKSVFCRVKRVCYMGNLRRECLFLPIGVQVMVGCLFFLDSFQKDRLILSVLLCCHDILISKSMKVCSFWNIEFGQYTVVLNFIIWKNWRENKCTL